jgi:hypothetical protein
MRRQTNDDHWKRFQWSPRVVLWTGIQIIARCAGYLNCGGAYDGCVE